MTEALEDGCRCGPHGLQRKVFANKNMEPARLDGGSSEVKNATDHISPSDGPSTVVICIVDVEPCLGTLSN